MSDVNVEHKDGFVLARLSGELTATEGEGVINELHEYISGPEGRLAVDLSDLKLIDSTGLSLMMNLVTRARLAKGNVVLVSPSNFVSGVLEVTRLNTWFDICENVDEAAGKLKQ